MLMGNPRLLMNQLDYTQYSPLLDAAGGRSGYGWMENTTVCRRRSGELIPVVRQNLH
ncbi:hypothetical protein GCM10007071_27750 [Marinobacter zhanjiangensis]|uniref:Uncharacterized protein n=1 Tax=Marinobacter zhanjiangensis TaxID=578215 RepID=A0ABQ3B4P6_9GAMM|nr:hypothetical protein GCM10007071_27750 [Marinobacter zhanjiangensis]